MQGTHHPERRTAATAASLLLAGAALAGPARADDLVTLSGKTYHDVQPVRVEPDGVTWRYAEGICKVDFADSPQAVRVAYRYDAAKATAYHEARAQEQRQTAEESQRLVQAQAARQRRWATAQAQTASAEAGASATGTPTITYRHGLAPAVEAAARALDEQAAAQKAQAAADARNSEGLLGNPAIWKYVPGVGSKPVPQRADIPNAQEYKASLHHTPGGFTDTIAQDNFYNPLYLTRSYNEDVDRAAAYARGVPLK